MTDRPTAPKTLAASADYYPAAPPDPGLVGIWYLKKWRGRLIVTSRPPALLAVGSFGTAPELRLRTDLYKSPAVEVNDFRHVVWPRILLYQHHRARHRKPAHTGQSYLTGYEYDNSGDPADQEPSASISGAIRYDRIHDRFDVTYSGSRTGRLLYERARQGYARTGRIIDLPTR